MVRWLGGWWLCSGSGLGSGWGSGSGSGSSFDCWLVLGVWRLALGGRGTFISCLVFAWCVPCLLGDAWRLVVDGLLVRLVWWFDFGWWVGRLGRWIDWVGGLWLVVVFEFFVFGPLTLVLFGVLFGVRCLWWLGLFSIGVVCALVLPWCLVPSCCLGVCLGVALVW